MLRGAFVLAYTATRSALYAHLPMPIAESYEDEKLELESLLSSGIFDRAPNLSQLLTYVCAKYFEGEAEGIKEYNIAVEALGRPAEFDQKRDSIVRVEAHRLRKRLREYYDGEGAAHSVQIEIPSGQYAPRFVHREAALSPPAIEIIAPAAADSLSNRRLAWIAAVFLCSLWVVWSLTHGKTAAAPSNPAPAAAHSDEVRILAGLDSGTYTDGFGRVWQSDKYFDGGTVFRFPSPRPILGTRDPSLYQGRREGQFSYDIPLKPGTYELRLYFAETLYGDNNAAGGGETTRIFNVLMNGMTLLREFDVIGEMGPSAANVKVFKDVVPASDGQLHLRFEPHSNTPFLNAIEILPSVAGKIHPLRIAAHDRGFTDREGRSWEPDRYAMGGQLVSRSETIANASDPEIYRGERYGNLTYTLPVAQNGKYGLTLHFAETWFGPGMPGGGGAGSRVFDILCNGVALKRNFDIYKEAGGSDRAITYTVHDLEPNHQGKLVISLVPAQNYACINALELVDESR